MVSCVASDESVFFGCGFDFDFGVELSGDSDECFAVRCVGSGAEFVELLFFASGEVEVVDD